MTLRRCTVSFESSGHQRREAQIDADSLFEAAVIALKVFHSDANGGPQKNDVLEITVDAPKTYRVRIDRLLAWIYHRRAKTAEQRERQKWLQNLFIDGR